MAQQSLIWTALPNGYTADGSGLRLSVLLSPRLDPQIRLGTSKLARVLSRLGGLAGDAGERDVRRQLRRQGTVSIPPTTTRGRTASTLALGLADSAVWKALFTGDLLVKGFEYKDLSPSGTCSRTTPARWRMDRGPVSRSRAQRPTDRLPRVTEIIERDRWREFIMAVDALDEPLGRSRHQGCAIRGGNSTRCRRPRTRGRRRSTTARSASSSFIRRRRRRLRGNAASARTTPASRRRWLRAPA